ncbi:hypothetical protein ACFLW3_01030, partial [Chloroflexota bacterium]
KLIALTMGSLLKEPQVIQIRWTKDRVQKINLNKKDKKILLIVPEMVQQNLEKALAEQVIPRNNQDKAYRKADINSFL